MLVWGLEVFLLISCFVNQTKQDWQLQGTVVLPMEWQRFVVVRCLSRRGSALSKCMSSKLWMHRCVLAGPSDSAVASSLGGGRKGRTCRLSLKAFERQAPLSDRSEGRYAVECSLDRLFCDCKLVQGGEDALAALKAL